MIILSFIPLKPIKLLLTIILGQLIISSCQKHDTSIEKHTEQNTTQNSEKNTTLTKVLVSSSPDPIPLNQYFALNITLNDSKYKNVTPSDIDIQALMPSHGHGMNVTPIVSYTEQKSIVANGMLLHMKGRWQIIITVRLGQYSDKIQLDIEV